MKFLKLINHKFILGFTNLLFLACGIILLISGFYVFSDEQRILLSRLLGAGNEILSKLPQPFFYYIALSLTAAGIIAVFASIIGWWAICMNNYCILIMYFLIVLFLLLMEFGACLLITLWPHCLGLNLDETVMVKALQGNYGVPGKEQLTAAMDLSQTYFKCCAINSNINYDTSLWRLQGYGQREWTVPLTCCHLSNENDLNSYLDPKPINITICQSLQRHEYEKSRHIDGCLGKIDVWYRKQYSIFLVASLFKALIEFCVMLSIIFNCTKLQKFNRKIEFDTLTTNNGSINLSNNNRSAKINGQIDSNGSNSIILPPHVGTHNYTQPSSQSDDLYKNKYIMTTFINKPSSIPKSSSSSSSSKYRYQVSKSYLV